MGDAGEGGVTAKLARRVARGIQRTDGSGLRIVITFDPDTFGQIRDRAERLDTSFGEQVRTLVEWGLEADEAPNG